MNEGFQWPIAEKVQILRSNITSSDIFEQKSCIFKKFEGDSWINQKRAHKNDGICFDRCISSLSFHGLTMIYNSWYKNDL